MALEEKPRKFSCIDFKRWQQKMFFYLNTLCLQWFTRENTPEVPEGTFDKDRFIIVEAWKHSDFLCRNYILSGLQDDLYNVYSVTKTSKDLWGHLNKNIRWIEKLPPLWKDFKNYLKHKCKEITIEDHIVRLRIEEDNKAAERKSKENSTINGAHIIEDDQNNSKKRKKAEQGSNQPKKKFKGKCINCGNIGHKYIHFHVPTKGKKKD
ncbi:hypothetical protein CQW23_01937 [Capsicum baccatum]|uniref:Uncharacterized protein n=1 Tax=Capsicum baccatum TaxID=33114 RepID=A0A2G2XQ14_CAPBA|nr:hypothetical protein CQW23_01937 [Capsicum baccatum]